MWKNSPPPGRRFTRIRGSVAPSGTAIPFR